MLLQRINKTVKSLRVQNNLNPNYLSQFTDQTLTGLDKLIDQEQEETTQHIGRNVWQYIEEDAEEILRNCHPSNHPEANCQELAKRLLLKNLRDKLADNAISRVSAYLISLTEQYWDWSHRRQLIKLALPD